MKLTPAQRRVLGQMRRGWNLELHTYFPSYWAVHEPKFAGHSYVVGKITVGILIKKGLLVRNGPSAELTELGKTIEFKEEPDWF